MKYYIIFLLFSFLVFSPQIVKADQNFPDTDQIIMAEDFEGEVFPPTNWSVSGPKNWIQITDDAQSGTKSAKLPNADAYSSYYLSTNIDLPLEGIITFYWKDDSHHDASEKFYFCLDDENCNNVGNSYIFGNYTGWHVYTQKLAAGSHTLKWLYSVGNKWGVVDVPFSAFLDNVKVYIPKRTSDFSESFEQNCPTPINPSTITEGFEGSFPPTGWVLKGTPTWATSATAHDGTKSVSITSLTNQNWESSIQRSLTVDSGIAVVSFWWRTDGGHLAFCIDEPDCGMNNNLTSSGYGDNSWIHVYTIVPKGTHALTWKQFTFPGENTARHSYLDNVVIEFQQPNSSCLSSDWLTGGIQTWSVDNHSGTDGPSSASVQYPLVNDTYDEYSDLVKVINIPFDAILTFNWKMTGSWHNTYFCVDKTGLNCQYGNAESQLNEPNDWVQVTQSLSAGIHVLDWQYIAWSGSNDFGNAWVDNINLTLSGTWIESTPTPTLESTPTPTLEPTPTPTLESTPTPTLESTPTPTLEPAPTSSSNSTVTSDYSDNQSINNFHPTCNSQFPYSAPNLFQINTNKNTATLFFAPAQNPVNKYFIAYGTNKNNLQYGVEYPQGYSNGALFYTVNLLSPNTTYFFKVRAGNDCMPGPWSAIVPAKTANSLKTIKKFYPNTLIDNPPSTITTSFSPQTSILTTPTLIPSPNLPTTTPLKPNIPKSKKRCFLWWCF